MKGAILGWVSEFFLLLVPSGAIETLLLFLLMYSAAFAKLSFAFSRLPLSIGIAPIVRRALPIKGTWNSCFLATKCNLKGITDSLFFSDFRKKKKIKLWREKIYVEIRGPNCFRGYTYKNRGLKR